MMWVLEIHFKSNNILMMMLLILKPSKAFSFWYFFWKLSCSERTLIHLVKVFRYDILLPFKRIAFVPLSHTYSASYYYEFNIFLWFFFELMSEFSHVSVIIKNQQPSMYKRLLFHVVNNQQIKKKGKTSWIKQNKNWKKNMIIVECACACALLL